MKKLRKILRQRHMVSDTNGLGEQHVVSRVTEEKLFWVYKPSGKPLTEYRYARQLNLRGKD